MKKIEIPYKETGYFSKLITAYLDEHEALKPFYNNSVDIVSFEKVIEQRAQLPVERTILSEVLSQQYDNIQISESTQLNIHQLKNGNCFTVTTGHQLNLFTGPVYFIYKIVSAINLARALKIQYPSKDFVPVYWMATEDHDIEEVNHFNLFNKRYELVKTQSGAVGRMRLDGIEELLSELKTDIGDRNGAEELINLFTKYYNSSNTYDKAIKGIVNHLFGKYGLVIVDGDDGQLKSLMQEEFKSELLEKKNQLLISVTSESLSELGYKPQFNPREINLFYLKEDLRERIVFEDNKYKVLNTSVEFSETEILEELDYHPDRFSPNAAMRCLYQEKVLPNLAYIGGGGELAYWLQLKEMFKASNISFPTLVLRNSVLVVDGGSSKRLNKLGLTATDLFKDVDVLIKEYIKKTSEITLELREEEDRLEAVFNEIADKAKSIDPSMEPMVKAEFQKSIKALKNIEGRLIKAEKKKGEVAVGQITNLKEKLFPKGSLQERHDNMISLLLFYGEDVVEELLNQLNPLDKQFIILSAE